VWPASLEERSSPALSSWFFPAPSLYPSYYIILLFCYFITGVMVTLFVYFLFSSGARPGFFLGRGVVFGLFDKISCLENR